MSVGTKKADDAAVRQALDARFRTQLMNYFMRRVESRAEAENLTQETFVRLIGTEPLPPEEQVQFFVFRVASNLLHDRVRTLSRQKRQAVETLDVTAISEFTREIAEDRDPERVLMGRESLAEVLAALGELGERTKNIFILFRLEGMKQKDIAARYGMAVSTVEKHIIRATACLSQRYGARRQ